MASTERNNADLVAPTVVREEFAAAVAKGGQVPVERRYLLAVEPLRELDVLNAEFGAIKLGVIVYRVAHPVLENVVSKDEQKFEKMTKYQCQ